MKYEWENRQEYCHRKAEDVVKKVQDAGISFLGIDRKLMIEEIESTLMSVVIDVREAELKASRKW